MEWSGGRGAAISNYQAVTEILVLCIEARALDNECSVGLVDVIAPLGPVVEVGSISTIQNNPNFVPYQWVRSSSLKILSDQ